MNTIFKSISFAAAGLLAGVALQSCALDQPFGQDGEGVLQMKLVINSDVTRAENDQEALSANCVVYISGAKGLLHKYQGLENVPEQVNMKAGHYVAEAWTGDSVSASFDSKFFRGYQPFDITNGVEQVVLNCKIQNVVVSINADALKAVPMTDYNIKVENSRGSLDFTADNFETHKGYFMMPNGDTDIKVTLTGKNAAGADFSKEYTIENVQRAHEYMLKLEYNPTYEEEGGSFVTITVDDSEMLVESEVEIFGRPYVTGVGFDADKQILGNAGAWKQQILKVKAFGAIENMIVSSDDWEAFGLVENRIDLKHCTDEVATQTKAAGLDWDESYNAEHNLATSFITLSAAMLNNLPERDSEYVLNVEVKDKYGKTVSQNVRFAVGEGAVVIEDPITINHIDQQADLMAVGTTKATVTGSLVSPEAVNPGVEYREAGTSGEWTFVALSESTVNAVSKRRNMSAAQIRRAPGKAFSINLKGLKPSTRYEYRGVAEGFASEVEYFTTEGKFAIPNADMEGWHAFVDDGKVIIPSSDGQRTFWDSGNHGSATMNVNLTQQFSDFKHAGNSCGRLRSQNVYLGMPSLGKFAAGNIFSGTYLETQGTDGRLEFGRQYDSSHPDKLRVFVNYRPGTVDKYGAKSGYLSQGSQDIGQIYIALTTAPIEIRTKSSTRKLFPMNPGDEDYEKVIAFGEKTFDSAYGADNTLEMLEIPFEYRENAKTQKPLYIVIVCTASKYGDYFCGGEGSVFYVDDFELIYE